MNKEYLKEFLNEYYITFRKEFVRQTKNGYKTIRRTLTDREINDHLKKKYAIAIKVKNVSKFLGLDLDTNNVNILQDVHNSLLRFFNQNQVLITVSGKKGYHIDLFFSNVVSTAKVKELYNIILAETELRPNLLECRGHNEQAYKLPFSKHQETGNECIRVNQYNQKIDSLNDIEKIDSEYLKEILEINSTNAKNKMCQKPFKNKIVISDDEKIKELETAYKRGITRNSTRHIITFNVILYFKEVKKLGKEETRKEVLIFLRRELETHKQYIKSSEKTILQELESTLNTVYGKDYKILSYRKKITLTFRDMKHIVSISNNNKLRVIYMTLYSYAKAFQGTTNSNKGSFFCTYTDIKKISGINNNKTIKKYIDELVEMSLLEIVSKKYKQVTVYRCKNLLSTAKEDIIYEETINNNKRKKDYLKLFLMQYSKTQRKQLKQIKIRI